jgi:hypothetical protein
MTLGGNFAVRLTTGAELDLIEAEDYYFSIELALGDRFMAEAFDRMGKLSTFWAHPIRKNGIRRVTLEHFPYSIFYKVDTDLREVVIESIKHNRKKVLPGQY